ncbi:CAP domain-containing protein [Janthinobacterium agaricidamnosum]|uniref:SCP-like extracellular family protein n=1 Tax=Janthinobacterium agaricidamnosum NBRC 102515 = DSM 9628 TaxID=1349767 RepID=W0UZV5_9BURK|nr:CAP domain-containing protein [Janthinobacterium agaricidamnosum]CDG80905.1 SCP-like extracellular family protein [Janthinobacterium agaricidamnosum NBRC 102515 = DSM 9628]
MALTKSCINLIPALLVAAILSACGGNNSKDDNSTSTDASLLVQEPGAPVVTNNTATDGFNWFNYRRGQAGLSLLARNSLIDRAAQGHSDYLKTNNTVSHDQVAGKPGFTGADDFARLSNAGYQFQRPYAYGEVIAGAQNSSGFFLAEELITAIYHRFVILQPIFKDAGAGSATGNGGYYYFTTNFAASNDFSRGLGSGRIITYPFSNQTRVATSFSSDHESPDPVPNQDIVGYPISVHADITSNLVVRSFTVAPRGGSAMSVRLLTAATDSNTPSDAAAIIPLAVLSSNTTYDVTFNGSANGVDVSRKWSFTTR